MVLISKEEKDAIRKEFPKIGIVRTMRQRSSRHRYYCEEAPQVMRYLNEVRNRNVVERHFSPDTKRNGKDVRHAAGAKRTRN